MFTITQSEIKALDNTNLISSTETWLGNARRADEILIWHLQEIQDRKLFLEMNYPDMFQCLVKHFKCGESTAYAKLVTLRLVKEVPSIGDDLTSGELLVSNLKMAQAYINKHEKETGEKLKPEDKADLIEKVKNKTEKECKAYFAKIDPVMALPHDKIVPLNETHSQIQVTVKNELIVKIEYLKSLISHENINPSLEELFTMALDAVIEQKEKKKGLHQKKPKETKGEDASKDVKTETPQAFAKNSRYVPCEVKQQVLSRSGHQCEHIHADGTRCNSKFQLQFDHITAFSKGGPSTYENMQILCRVHNAHKSYH